MKKIVIIGANDFQNQLILKAKEMGFETHVFAWQDGSIGERTADHFYPVSIVEIDEILEIDVERRAINAAVDNMKAEQNRVSKLIPQYKKEGKDVAPILAEMKELSDKITEDGAKLAELEEKQDIIIHAIPNIPHESVPIDRQAVPFLPGAGLPVGAQYHCVLYGYPQRPRLYRDFPALYCQ